MGFDNFSATGNILAWSQGQSDMCYVYRIEKSGDDKKKIQPIIVGTSFWNSAGQTFLVGVFTGVARTLLSIVHCIVHLVCAIFGAREHHLNEAKIGGLNLARGLIELVPIVGQYAMKYYDDNRTAKNSEIDVEDIKKTLDQREENTCLVYMNNVLIHEKKFIKGDEKNKIDDEFLKAMASTMNFVQIKLGLNPTISQIDKMFE